MNFTVEKVEGGYIVTVDDGEKYSKVVVTTPAKLLKVVKALVNVDNEVAAEAAEPQLEIGG